MPALPGKVAAEAQSKPLPPPAPGAPESVCQPSSGILGDRAKAGEVTLDEVTRDFVSRAYVRANGNTAQTARSTGLDRRTVERWLDRDRLDRWLKKKGSK